MAAGAKGWQGEGLPGELGCHGFVGMLLGVLLGLALGLFCAEAIGIILWAAGSKLKTSVVLLLAIGFTCLRIWVDTTVLVLVFVVVVSSVALPIMRLVRPIRIRQLKSEDD